MTQTPRAYLDTNVFIAAFETIGDHQGSAWSLLQAVEDGRLIGVTSELTLAELLVKPFERGAMDLAEAYDAMLTPSETLMVCAVDRRLLVEAARLRSSRPGLKLPDAIHVATAARTGCDVMISDDRGLAGPAMSRIPLGADCLVKVLGAAR